MLTACGVEGGVPAQDVVFADWRSTYIKSEHDIITESPTCNEGNSHSHRLKSFFFLPVAFAPALPTLLPPPRWFWGTYLRTINPDTFSVAALSRLSNSDSFIFSR
jgi:hypothetical protein